MAFSFSKEKRGGCTIDWLENSDAGLRIGISRLGAELISIQRRDPAGEWIGFLHRDNDLVAPATGWMNHAPVMGYYLHRLKNERSLYRGHEIRGGTHSFARTKNWHLIEQHDGVIKYRITPEDFSPTDYPLNVGLDLTYSIEREQLRIQFHFTNAEPRLSAHVEFGVHPGFAASSFDSFAFRMPAGLYRRYFSPGNFLSGETQDIEFAGGPMPFKREELPGSFIVELVHVSSREFVFEDRASKRAVAIDLGSAPYLTIWSDGGAFLCLEPCWGLTDAHEQRAFEDKLGIQVIPPGGELIAQCAISPRFLPA
jgi:galactose mutarotase-like enzyme